MWGQAQDPSHTASSGSTTAKLREFMQHKFEFVTKWCDVAVNYWYVILLKAGEFS